jgi:hypothetical protein
MLTVTDGKSQVRLDYEDSIDLELKLNVSAYGKKWSHIGDMLYAYGTKTKGKIWEFEVEKEELQFLIRLLEKATWEHCKGMA